MRTRNRSTVVEHLGSIVIKLVNDTDHGGWFSPEPTYSLPHTETIITGRPYHSLFSGVTGVVEEISDLQRPGHFNPCYHSKVTYDAPLAALSSQGQIRESYLSQKFRNGPIAHCEFVSGVSKALLDNARNEPSFSVSDEQMLLEAASKANPTVVRQSFDVSQQIGEMREGLMSLNRGLKAIARIRRDVDRLDRWNSPAVRRTLGHKTFEQMSLSDWALLATSAHLGYNLAIAPLVGACKKLHKAFANYDVAVGRYMSTEDVFHGISKRVYNHTWEDAEVSYRPYKAGCTIVSSKEVRATVRVRYGPNLFLRGGRESANRTGPRFDSAFDSTYFGATPTFATAWALMPFSFVVDWFIGLGRYLAQWSEKPIEGLEYEILETGWSVKTTTSVSGFLQPAVGLDSDMGRLKAAGIATGTKVSVNYLREPKSFDATLFTPSPPTFGLPNFGQVVTLVELIAQLVLGKSDLFRVKRPGSG